MKLTKEYTLGQISNRLLRALQCCEASKLIHLKRSGNLRLPANEYIVTHNAMLFDSFSAYCKATDTPAYYFLHGDEPAENRYSAYDSIVIEFIDMLEIRQQKALLDCFQSMYPKSIPEKFKGMRITDKIQALVSMLPYGYLTRIVNRDATVPRYERLNEEALVQMERIKTTGCRTGVLATDAIPSISSFLGVSLHFMMGLEVPLYCKNQEGDLLFDYYTLLNDDEKKTFFKSIVYYVENEMARLMRLTSKLKEVNKDALS